MFGVTVRKYEREFETDTLENRHVFYDLYIKSDDPQELRNDLSESLTDMNYKVMLNEMTKFEDSELEETFRGGNAKPIRVYLKAAKDNVKGSRYPILWKSLLVLGIVLAVILLTTSRDAIYSALFQASAAGVASSPSSLLVYSTIAAFVLTLVFLLVRDVVPMFVWTKIIGIYDPTEESANVRLVLAGECQFKDKDSYAKLESDLSELYSELSRKYANKLNKRSLSESVTSGLAIGRGANQKLTNKLRDIEKELADLERSFAGGKISEDSYKELKSKLETKEAQLETITDLLLP